MRIKLPRHFSFFVVLSLLILLVVSIFLPTRKDLSTTDFWYAWDIGQKRTSAGLIAELGEKPTRSFPMGGRIVHEWEMRDGQIHIECDQNDKVTNAYARESRPTFIMLDWLRRNLKVPF
jgi:hypothetical protein